MNNVYIAHRGELSLAGLNAILRESRWMVCVGSASDGFRAVADVLALRPDVVVLAQSLEGMNGISVTREILREWPECRVIGVVKRVAGEAVIGFLDAGARVVVSEEECPVEFSRAVERLDGGRPYLGRVVNSSLTDQGVGEALIRYARVRRLSQREMQVLQLIAEGQSTRETAERLCVSVKTVETHRAKIMEKVGIRSIAGLTKYAIENGITDLAAY